MTPEERRAMAIHVRACQCGSAGICPTHAAVASAIRVAVAEARVACATIAKQQRAHECPQEFATGCTCREDIADAILAQGDI